MYPLILFTFHNAILLLLRYTVSRLGMVLCKKKEGYRENNMRMKGVQWGIV